MAEISIKAEEVTRILGIPITNALLLSLVTLVVLLGIAFLMRKQVSLIPGRLQSLLELAFEELLGLMDSVLGSRALSERHFPLIATIFLFILTSNWLGLLPLAPIGVRHGAHLVPLFRSPASDLNFTITLAIISVLSVNILGVVTIGAGRHLSKFFTVKNPILTFAGLLEFISEFVKIISFSFRLFGNVFAGEVLLTIVGFLVPYVVPLPFLFLEVFVGLVQAFIFSMLTLVFVAMAVAEHGEH
jgi:F-type H+-transporting ATPase subunit a